MSFVNLTEIGGGKIEDDQAVNPNVFLSMDEMTALHIRRSLVLSKGRVEGRGGAADLLGMNPSTLRGRMRKLGIRISRGRIESVRRRGICGQDKVELSADYTD